MTKLMTNETPAKVMGLLAVSLSSMFFLFAVCVTNANFNQTQNAFPDPFNPAKVVAMVDNVSNSYSNFLSANLFRPAQNSYAIYQYNLAYVMDNAAPSIMAMTGLQNYAYDSYLPGKPTVAGASTQVPSSQVPAASVGGFSLGGALYSLLSPR